jgi:hypothetical protein
MYSAFMPIFIQTCSLWKFCLSCRSDSEFEMSPKSMSRHSSIASEVGWVHSHAFIPVRWARVCKRLRSPGIDSKEWIPPAYIAWRTGTSNRIVVPARQAGISILWAPWKVYKYGLWLQSCREARVELRFEMEIFLCAFSRKLPTKMQTFLRKHYRKNW